MQNDFVLIGTKEGHVIIRIEWIRSVVDHSDVKTTILYGEGTDDTGAFEVAWPAERIYRAIREAQDAD